MDKLDNISSNIKRIRERKGLKQLDVAKSLDMDAPNYHRLENRGNKLTIEQLKLIASALEVSVYDLLSTDNEVLLDDVFNEIFKKYPGKESDWLNFNIIAIAAALKILAFQLGIGNFRRVDTTGTIFRIPMSDLTKSQMDDLTSKGWTTEFTEDHKAELLSIINTLINSLNSITSD